MAQGENSSFEIHQGDGVELLCRTPDGQERVARGSFDGLLVDHSGKISIYLTSTFDDFPDPDEATHVEAILVDWIVWIRRADA